jgi:hypothetical protein
MTRDDRFTRYDNGTVLDTCTQLMWMTHDYYNLEGKAPPLWETALAWPVKMNQRRYAGHNDWRAATLAEYETIYTPKKPRRSHRGSPVGYPDAFADGGGEWCWTEELASFYSTHMRAAYIFDFIWGQLGQAWFSTWEYPLLTYQVGSIRLVRGPLSTSRLPATTDVQR